MRLCAAQAAAVVSAAALGVVFLCAAASPALAAQRAPAEQDPGKDPAMSPHVETLEALWKALRDHYPMMEYAGAHGDEWLEELRPKVAAAPSDEAAYLLMDELVCRLNDYHTRFWWPDQPRLESPPVRVEVVARGSGDETGGRRAPRGEPPLRPFTRPPLELPDLTGFAVAVTEAPADSGLKPGDEVLEVDGRPVLEALAEAWRHSRGSSESAKLREACWRLLLGSPDRPVELRVRPASGLAVRSVSIRRSGFPEEPAVSAREVEGVPVLRISRFGNAPGEDLAAEVDRLLERYRDRPGIVFDVRGNGGGLDELGDRITGRFISKPVIASISFHREVPGLTYRRTVEWTQPRGPWRYEGRVAVLTDEACRSACEHFVSGMAEAGALLCGTPTDGACGWSRTVDLPGGARVSVSRTFPLHTAGIPSPHLGIVPHLWRPRTLPDLREGRDAALEAALRWLKSADPLPQRVHPL